MKTLPSPHTRELTIFGRNVRSLPYFILHYNVDSPGVIRRIRRKHTRGSLMSHTMAFDVMWRNLRPVVRIVKAAAKSWTY